MKLNRKESEKLAQDSLIKLSYADDHGMRDMLSYVVGATQARAELFSGDALDRESWETTIKSAIRSLNNSLSTLRIR